MVMETLRTTSPYSVVSEFEGTLLKSEDSFSYFMLLAFDASGLLRFAVLLFLWPVIKLLNVFSFRNAALKLMIFVATAGLRQTEIVSVARTVLPKFYMDDVSMDTWSAFSSCKKRVVVTRMPRVMVERFAKEHLRADEVIGTELIVNRFGFVTGLIRETDIDRSLLDRVADLCVDRRPHLGLGRASAFTTFLSLCEICAPVPEKKIEHNDQLRPVPVVFNDGRLVKRPTPATALLILLWIPFGIVLSVSRILLMFMLPWWLRTYVSRILGVQIIVKGKPPQPQPRGGAEKSGVLFVCSHRSPMDPLIVSSVLERGVPAIVYSLSRFSEIFCPIPIVRIKRIRDVDAKKIKQELTKGDLVICPEGATCRQPFLLRFSPLFAELTDKIVPVALKCRLGYFHADTARGWNGMDMIFFFMNPFPVYEATFLNQLPLEETCSSGKSPCDVANHVQSLMAGTLGFECTNFSRKDKFMSLVGKDGTLSYLSFKDQAKKIVNTFSPVSH